jgi:small conductance mechanosensitive channel
MDLWFSWLGQTGWKVFTIVGICLAVFFVLRRAAPLWIRKTVKKQMKGKRKVEREKRVQTLTQMLSTIVGLSLGTLATFLVLHQLGINIYAGIAALGVIGIAVGFGTQHLIRDLIGGFFILLENQYNCGDVIQTNNIIAMVEEISLRRTVLRDLDGIHHVVPNGEIRIVGNLTQDLSRVNLDIPVAYGEDVDQVMAIMKQTWEELANDPTFGSFIITKTPFVLRVNEFGDSGVIIKITGETEPHKQWDIKGEYRRRIKKAFDREGIEIPWPHRKVYFGNTASKDNRAT